MCVFILSHFCHWPHTITQTLCVRTHTHIQGCSAHFSSLMGYQYHQKRCGQFSDDEKPVFLCQHCGKTYRSKAGRDYHVRTEHSPTITTTMMTPTNNNNNNNRDNITDTNNNTGKERVRSPWKTVVIIGDRLFSLTRCLEAFFTRFCCTKKPKFTHIFRSKKCRTSPPGGL